MMKKEKSYLIDINKYLVIIALMIWCIFAFKMLTSQIIDAFKRLPKICSLNLEQKYRLIDGNFYDFIKFCETKIPERENILFKIVPKEPDFGTQNWFLSEYFISKSAYYFYPRKVFREKDATPGIRYQIVYDTNAKTFGLYSQ